MTDPDFLEKEAVLFSRYLVKADPPADLVHRYIRANQNLYPEEGAKEEAAVLNFTVRHPWSIPFLDGASAFLMKGSLLRGKILILLSILEADPRYTRYFVPPKNSIPVFLIKGLILGGLGVLTVLAGLALFPLARRGS